MMRRTLALLVGLGLMAGTVEAQKPVVTATADSAVQAAGRIVETWDSLQYQVRVCARSSKGVAITATGHCTSRTLAWYLRPKAPPPPPPADTTPTPPPPPPVDTTPKPPAAGTLFGSDWAGGLLDGGKWEFTNGNADLINIVPAAGRGFPAGMANVVRVRMGTGQWGWLHTRVAANPPRPGESRAYRIYLRNEIGPEQGWSSTHPVESEYAGGGYTEQGGYAWHIGSYANGTFPIAFSPDLGYPRNHWTPANHTGSTMGWLNDNQTYRLEWKFTRSTSDTTRYTFDLRWSDAAGNVVADKNSIKAFGGGLLASYGAQLIPLTAKAATSFRVGINGGPSLLAGQYVYWGGFAVCTDWCGAY